MKRIDTREWNTAVYARLVSALFLLGTVTACCGPSEHALRTGFQEHKSDLEAIVQLSNMDTRVVRIAPAFTRLSDDWSWPRPKNKWGLTESRWNRYRQLFRQAGIQEGISREDGKISFLVKNCGLSISGSSSGYVYCQETLSPVVEHLSDLRSKGTAYVHLEGNWYLFYERD